MFMYMSCFELIIDNFVVLAFVFRRYFHVVST